MLPVEPALRVAFIYMKGRAARLAEVERGEMPSEFFYGSIEMTRRGYEIAHFEIDPDAPANLSERLLGRIFPGPMRPVKTNPGILVQAYRLAAQLNRADCLVATGGNIAYALAALARFGIIRKPIVGIQCGVLHYHHGWLRRMVSRALLLKMHTLLFGDSELRPMREFFDLPAGVISVNHFGVDARFWQPNPATPRDIVLAIGNDSRRDFATLVAAAEFIPLPVHIVTSMPLPPVLPANVTHHRGSWHGAELSDVQIRELYQRAKVVVVPLRPNIQPSGQSVTLQAMACGCPVVLTETEGLWSREQMQDGQNVILVRPGDSEQLAARVCEVMADEALAARLNRAGRATVERSGNIEAFAAEVARCCARLPIPHGNTRTPPAFC
jgi:glycosyltransferase involved in cell wall biosynthesis